MWYESGQLLCVSTAKNVMRTPPAATETLGINVTKHLLSAVYNVDNDIANQEGRCT